MKKQLLLLLAFTSAFAMNAQVTLVKEINDSGTSSSFPANLFVFNNNIYFAADDSNGSNSPGAADLGKELWVTDGTETGTTFVKDLRAGSDSSSPSFFFEINSTMFFSANTGSGNVLFSSDGTEAGTTATGGTFVFNPLEMGGIVYYILSTDSNSLHEFNGTTQVKVANSGTEDVQFSGGQFTSLNNKIIGYGKTTTDDPTIGIELYEYDPATDAYTLIKDITGDDGNAGISNFVTIGSEVYFEAQGKVWKTDGTTAGTSAVDKASAINSTNNYFVWNGNLYFEGDDGSNDQLWKYDPAADSVLNVSNITGSTATGGNNHDPSDYAVLGDYLYYRGETFDNSSGYVFRTNGTTSELLDDTIKDIDEITVLNGKLYFEGDDGVSGNELYSFDPATLSVGNNQAEIVRVFPNPTSDYIMVSKQLLKAPYAIHDITGKTVKEGIITNERIDFNLSSGLYLFKVKTELSTITKKIIVK
ncbi:T9SS type A sorting domain-containing protein [Algibacter sp.]|nr:T9SS type A sorting domain-containing protein [Algibacter sp.]MDB4273807.1 T9SS type A sorting domain-containing protein [Algibacter sp.]